MYKREQRDGAGLAHPQTVFLGADPPSAPDTRVTVIAALVSASWGVAPLIVGPIVNLWRLRPYDSDTLVRDVLLALMPIAVILATVLLLLFG